MRPANWRFATTMNLVARTVNARSALLALFALAICASSPVLADEAGSLREAIAAADVEVASVDGEIQSKLNALVDNDPNDRIVAFEVLETAARRNQVWFTQQLAYFLRDCDDRHAQSIVGFLIQAFEVQDSVIVEALIPLLEVNDPILLKHVYDLLGGYENKSAEYPPNFTRYLNHLFKQRLDKKPLPEGLIAYMFDSDPHQAIRVMIRASMMRDPEAIRELRWADHVVADVVWKWRFGFLNHDRSEPAVDAELRKLAVHDQWWARLYVAVVMEKHTALRSQRVLTALQDDDSAIVARFATRALSTAE